MNREDFWSIDDEHFHSLLFLSCPDDFNLKRLRWYLNKAKSECNKEQRIPHVNGGYIYFLWYRGWKVRID